MAEDVSMEELFERAEDQRAYEDFCAHQEFDQAFQLDKPALVCRWRMAKRQVPLLNRHIRALSQRTVNGAPLTRNMLSWAKQHVEWSLADGAYDDPNGVLMLVIDVNGNAAMTVGEYAALPDTSRAALERRAAQARGEQRETGVAPEVLCSVRDGALRMGVASGEPLSGAMTLVEQLAQTCGHAVVRTGGLQALEGAAFLVSDEHGVVPASDRDEASDGDAAFVRFLADGVAKLF